MSILARIRGVLRDKANAAIDRLKDPAKQLDAMLLEMRDAMQAATAELVGYKATEKRMAQRAAELVDSAAAWRKRAEAAVIAGDDALARSALLEAERVRADAAQVARERAEMASYAKELLTARRELEQRIKSLELRKGTLAQEVASARRAGGGPLAAEGQAWDALARAEDRIALDDAMAEVDAAMDPAAEADAETYARFRQHLREVQADQALAELKQKMGK
jgi:phage shock protein A